MSQTSRAIILLSGGLDSATCLALANSKHSEIFALSFDYGQRNKFEFQKAIDLANFYKVNEHKVVKIDLSIFKGSSLTSDIQVEKNRARDEIGKNIPSTYVPARNTLFLSYAMAWADSIEADAIYIGVNQIDASGYPDCREVFINAMRDVAKFGTRSGSNGKTINIETPLINLTKPEIIELGLKNNLDYSKTISCYDPLINAISCGQCDACILRKEAFKKLNLTDPIKYK